MKPQIFLALVLATASTAPSVQAVEGTLQARAAHSPAVVDPAEQQRVDEAFLKGNEIYQFSKSKGSVKPSQEAVNSKFLICSGKALRSLIRFYSHIISQEALDIKLLQLNTVGKDLRTLIDETIYGQFRFSQDAIDKKFFQDYLKDDDLSVFLTNRYVRPSQEAVDKKFLQDKAFDANISILLSPLVRVHPSQFAVNTKFLDMTKNFLRSSLRKAYLQFILGKSPVNPDQATILECLNENKHRSHVVDLLVSSPKSIRAILLSSQELSPQVIESIKRVYSENKLPQLPQDVVDVLVSNPVSFKAILSSTQELPLQVIDSIVNLYGSKKFPNLPQDMVDALFKKMARSSSPKSYDILVTLLKNYRDKKPYAPSRELLERFSANPLENSRLKLLSKKPKLGGSKDVLSIIDTYFSDYGNLRNRLVESDVMKSIRDAWRREGEERKMMAKEDRGGVPADTENNVAVEQNPVVATQHHEQEESKEEGSLIHPSQNSQEKTLQDLEKNKKQDAETVENNQQLETAEHKGNLQEEDPEDMASDDKLQEVMKKHTTLDDID